MIQTVLVAFSLALMVYFIKASTWKGQIFEVVDRYLRRYIPEKLYKPLIGCNLCMTFWHSWYIYYIGHFTHVLGFEDIRAQQMLFTIFIACGFAALFMIFGKVQEDLKPIKDVVESE